MASLDILQEVKSLENSLKCKVCNNLLNDPLLIVKCGHTTCKPCFTKHLNMTCPVCNIPVNTRDSLEDQQLKELLAQLKNLKHILHNEQNSIQRSGESDASPKERITTKDPKKKECVTASKSVPVCSTPKVTRLSSKTPTELLSCEESIIQETPENRISKTPLTSSRTKKITNKKLSTSSLSSPNTSTQSPLGNINKKNHKGETLLHRSVIKGDIVKVGNLLKEGAAVNTQDHNGWTPLHEAANHGFVDLAELLLDHGALVNVPSLKDNITPLHDALLNYQIPMAVLLVSRGGDLHAKTSFGYTALDLCKTDEDRKVLIEACSPFIDASTLMPDSKAVIVKPDKIVLLSSNLNDNQKIQFQKCATMLKADVVDDFKSEVTHIVTSCDNSGNCTRTMKILMGVLTGKWLMNFQWIEVCLEYKQKVDEEVFEVQGTRNQPNTQGPKRGRQNYEQKLPPLFDGFYFYLHGSFVSPTPGREDLCNLVHLGGGKILSREPRVETVSTEPYMIPYHAAGTPLEETSQVILYQDKPPRDVHLNSCHICTTQVMWLVACISEYKLLPVQQTKITEK